MQKFIGIVLASIAVSSVSAQTTNSVSKVETDISSPNILKAIVPDRISYFSIFTGPAIGEADKVDSAGTLESNSINTWNQVSFGWKINENLRFVVNPRFIMNHNTSSTPFESTDMVTGIGGTWYKNGNFSATGGLNTILPFARTISNEQKGRLINPGGFNSVNYTINNKLSFSQWIWARYNIYDANEQVDDDGVVSNNETGLSFFTAPTISYSFSDDYGVSGYYQYNGSVDGDWDTTVDSDDHFGIIFKARLSSLLTLQPMLMFSRQTNYDVGKANFGMWLSGRFL